MGRQPVELDFGYWRRQRDIPEGAGLLSWNPTTGRLCWTCPGSGNVRLILARFDNADDVHAALAGWADANAEGADLTWVDERLRRVRT